MQNVISVLAEAKVDPFKPRECAWFLSRHLNYIPLLEAYGAWLVQHRYQAALADYRDELSAITAYSGSDRKQRLNHVLNNLK